jgi:hypothetical protein
MIPTNQTLTVTKKASQDAWGISTPGQKLTVKCRIDEDSKLVKDSHGKEVVSSARILIKGLVKIEYSDSLEWKDEIENVHTYKPLSIEIIRDFSGKPIFTMVVV